MRTLRWMFVVAAGFLLIAVAIRFVPDVAPEGDYAVIDIHVINAIRALEPVGAYSRFGWNHPGPTYSHLLAPLYWLSGYRHLAILVTVTLINVASLAVLLALRIVLGIALSRGTPGATETVKAALRHRVIPGSTTPRSCIRHERRWRTPIAVWRQRTGRSTEPATTASASRCTCATQTASRSSFSRSHPEGRGSDVCTSIKSTRPRVR